MKRYLFLTVTLVLFFSLAVNAFAASYYVATTGNNGNTGTKTQPWATLAYAANHISDGDTVIVRGGRYSSGCTILTNNVTFQAYSGETPIIDGDEVRPGSDWGTLITLKGNGITFDGFEVLESTGVNLNIEHGSGITVKNCNVHRAYRHNILIQRGASYTTIEDNDIHHGPLLSLYNDPTGNSSVGPPQISSHDSNSPTFRRNKIRDGYFEGLGIYRGTDDAIVEYNEIYGNKRVQLYISCSQNTVVRYNLIYGVATHRNPNAGSGNGPGIYMTVEPQCVHPAYPGEHKVYGNLVANTTRNLWIAGASDRQLSNCLIYNNTFVEATEFAFKVQSQTGGGHIVRNNIFWQTNGTIVDAPSGKVACDYNLWSRMPDSDVRGAHDLPYAVPHLVKTSGWSNLNSGDLNGSEFALRSASPAIDAGIPLGAEFDDIPECDKSVWPAQIVLMDQDNQGSGWEIGADIHVANPTALGAPTDLKIAAGQ